MHTQSTFAGGSVLRRKRAQHMCSGSPLFHTHHKYTYACTHMNTSAYKAPSQAGQCCGGIGHGLCVQQPLCFVRITNAHARTHAHTKCHFAGGSVLQRKRAPLLCSNHLRRRRRQRSSSSSTGNGTHGRSERKAQRRRHQQGRRLWAKVGRLRGQGVDVGEV